jgi:hypothetical protein
MPRNQVRITIERRHPFAGGQSFGHSGPYEWLAGKVSYAIDPDEAGLPHTCDLEAVKSACERPVDERLLFRKGADRLVETARSRNPLDLSAPLGPLVRALTVPGE